MNNPENQNPMPGLIPEPEPELVSNCCSAQPYHDFNENDVCPNCFEHCEWIEVDTLSDEENEHG